MKSSLTPGDGFEMPNDRATVQCTSGNYVYCPVCVARQFTRMIVLFLVHIVGRHNGRVFEDRDVTMVMGEGEDAGVVPGVEKALEKCKKGEIARYDVTWMSTFLRCFPFQLHMCNLLLQAYCKVIASVWQYGQYRTQHSAIC